MGYTIKIDGRVFVETDWAPLAQAAWNRASRDRNMSRPGGSAQIWKNDVLLADIQPATLRGRRWPDRDTPECTLSDVVKALCQLLRSDDWNAAEIADAMTAYGLPTTRSRIDALRSSTQGKRTEVTEAEIVVMLNAVLSAAKLQET
jgi:hypothetical protein